MIHKKKPSVTRHIKSRDVTTHWHTQIYAAHMDKQHVSGKLVVWRRHGMMANGNEITWNLAMVQVKKGTSKARERKGSS